MKDGTPQILSNSWDLLETTTPKICMGPDHALTRKLVDAKNEGIIVLFAADNWDSMSKMRFLPSGTSSVNCRIKSDTFIPNYSIFED